MPGQHSLKRWLSLYHEFARNNAATIATGENALRSLSYLLPGRFRNAELTSEIIYSLVNLLRLYHDRILQAKDKDGIRQKAWQGYLDYLKRAAPIASRLMTWLEILRYSQASAEMIAEKLLGVAGKYRVIVAIELFKAWMRLVIWWISGCRTLPSHFEVGRMRIEASRKSDSCAEPLLSEDDKQERLNEFLIQHKADVYTLVPEICFAKATSGLEQVRELAHIVRPLCYSIALMAMAHSNRRSWVPFLLSLGLDAFSEWPAIRATLLRPFLGDASQSSPLEAAEREYRLMQLLWYFMREPLYSTYTKTMLALTFGRLGQYWFLSTIAGMKNNMVPSKLTKNYAQTFISTLRLLEIIHNKDAGQDMGYPLLTRDGMEADALPILGALKAQVPPSLQPYFVEFGAFCQQKLWHELAGRLLEFYKDPTAVPFYVPLYRDFVSKLERHLSPMSFLQMSVAAARLLEPREGIALLEKIMKRFENDLCYQPEYTLVVAELGHLVLQSGNLQRAEALVETGSKLLEQQAGLASTIIAAFYRLTAEYNKATNEFAAYYKNSLMYLACVKLETLTTAERAERAHDLLVAALLGETTFNFGELLSHPVLAALEGHSAASLVDLLQTFHHGNIAFFDKMLPTINAHPALAPRLEFLRQKICLMALIELIFSSIKHGRRFSFDRISVATGVSPDQVEFLLMKALSLGLIRGSIDGIEQLAEVEWVCPRVLDVKQLQALQETMETWQKRVTETIQLANAAAPQLASAMAE